MNRASQLQPEEVSVGRKTYALFETTWDDNLKRKTDARFAIVEYVYEYLRGWSLVSEEVVAVADTIERARVYFWDRVEREKEANRR